ncbi:MAG: LamG-like jellyroll fold domain-containing protein [Thermoguttaceae bacterium]|jgi:autotransporter-associated beta strand protein|nr:LamG-like jellyroll fold domain-containing protein [Thermoguttaceae bacterium]
MNIVKPVLAAILSATAMVATVESVRASVVHSLFKPDHFGSLGALNATAGAININTDSLTFDFGGVRYGAAAISQGGGVELAVFTFDSIVVGSGVTINVTGNRGLVLASKGDFVFNSTLSLVGGNGSSGSNASRIAGGAGGPGADDGTPGGPTGSAPPGATRGNGGFGTRQAEGYHPVSDSFGHGAGGGLQIDNTVAAQGGAGGGGAYGGAGGDGGGLGGTRPGGAIYGDDLLTELLGGSGGGGGRYNGSTTAGGGGGGGGAVELIAAGSLTVSGTINVSGGIGGYGANRIGGGGGSGGGVILAARSIDVTGVSIRAVGGDGYINPDNSLNGGLGGGGGGGRVAFYANQLTGLAAETVDVSGGLKGTGQFGSGQTDGSAGTFRYFGDGTGSRNALLYSRALADDPALVSYWKLDDPAGSTTVVDSKGGYTGNVHTAGVVLGEPAPMSTLGQSAHFTRAAAGRITVPHNAAFNPEQFTVELWVKADSLSSGGGDWRSPLTSRGTGTGYLFYAGDNNAWQYWVGNGATTGSHWSTLSGPSVVADQWVHLVGTHDGTQQRFYINGHLVATQAGNYAPNTTSPLYMGTGADITNFAFDGNVANVSVLNVALDAQAIADHYNQESTYAAQVAAAASPVAHWRLGEQSGASAYNALNVTSLTGTYSNVTIREMDTPLGNDIDTAASFDGSSSSVTVPYNAALNPASFTVEAWARADGGEDSYRTVLSSRTSSGELHGFTLYANDANQWEFRVGTGATSEWHTTGGPAVTPGEWVHLVGAYDAGTGTKTFYVDGLKVASESGVSYVPNTTNDFFIGMGGDTGTEFPFHGLVDEVAVYGRALAPAAVNRHFLVAGTGAEVIHWVGGADLEWSAGSNWHSPGSPAEKIVVFGNAGASQSAGAVTNTVDTDYTVASLLYENSGNHHTTVIGAGSTLTLAADSETPRIFVAGSARIDGQLGGSQGIIKTGDGILTLGGLLDYTGETIVDGGTLVLNMGGSVSAGNLGQFGSAGHTITVRSGATLRTGQNWALGDGGQHHLVANGGTIHFQSTNYQNSIALTGAAITVSGTGWRTGYHGGDALITINESDVSSTIDGSIVFVRTTSASPGSGPPGRTTFNVANGAAEYDLIVSSSIQDYSQALNGMKLVKDGPGTMVLSGESTFIGGVDVDAGTLLVNNTAGSGTGAGPVAVNSGATLGGTGTIGGATTIEGGGTLATGTSIGQLTFESDLSFEDGAVWDWEFANNTPGNYDQAVGPNLILPTEGAITLNIWGLDGHSVGWYDEFTIFTGEVENTSTPGSSSWRTTPTGPEAGEYPWATAWC